MTTLIIGVVCLAIAVVLYIMVTNALKKTKNAAWVSDTMCAQVHGIVITAFGGGGVIFILGGILTMVAGAK